MWYVTGMSQQICFGGTRVVVASRGAKHSALFSRLLHFPTKQRLRRQVGGGVERRRKDFNSH